MVHASHAQTITHIRYIKILMTPRLWGQNCKFFTTLLPRNSQKRLEHKEDQTKFGRITRKPRSRLSRVRIVIYREWDIESLFQEKSAAKVHSLVNSRVKTLLPKNSYSMSAKCLLILRLVLRTLWPWHLMRISMNPSSAKQGARHDN